MPKKCDSILFDPTSFYLTILKILTLGHILHHVIMLSSLSGIRKASDLLFTSRSDVLFNVMLLVTLHSQKMSNLWVA